MNRIEVVLTIHESVPVHFHILLKHTHTHTHTNTRCQHHQLSFDPTSGRVVPADMDTFLEKSLPRSEHFINLWPRGWRGPGVDRMVAVPWTVSGHGLKHRTEASFQLTSRRRSENVKLPGFGASGRELPHPTPGLLPLHGDKCDVIDGPGPTEWLV